MVDETKNNPPDRERESEALVHCHTDRPLEGDDEDGGGDEDEDKRFQDY